MARLIPLAVVGILGPQTVESQKVWGHPKDGFDYPKREGYTLTLVEEFDEPLNMNNDPIWTWSDGGLSEGRVRFVKEAIQFQDGKMILEAKPNDTEPVYKTQVCAQANAGTFPGWMQLTSGEMRTRYNMFRYGYYEVSMKVPSPDTNDTSVNGNYIATMFAYKDAAMKHWREVDIEVVGNSPRSVVTNVLYAENTTRWSPEIAADAITEMDESLNLREGFHTYAFEWREDGITWFFDGVKFREYNGDKIPIPDKACKIMMSLWIFGKTDNDFWFGGSEGLNNQYPLQVEYDWFRFYKKDDDVYPPSDLSSIEGLTEDDYFLSGNNPCDGIEQEGLFCKAPTDQCEELYTVPGTPQESRRDNTRYLVAGWSMIGAALIFGIVIVVAKSGTQAPTEVELGLAEKGS